VNIDSGAWYCHRCQSSGNLREHWQPRERHRSPSRATARRAFALSPVESPRSQGGDYESAYDRLAPLAGTPGAVYLESRGIPAELAGGAGVRSADDWYGRPAVVFPIRDQTGRLVAMQGRHTDGRADPKAHDCGPKSTGVFATTGGRPGRIAGSDR
jgi:hypothetical protein